MDTVLGLYAHALKHKALGSNEKIVLIVMEHKKEVREMTRGIPHTN